MAERRALRTVLLVLVATGVLAVGATQLSDEGGGGEARGRSAVPVEVAPVEVGRIVERRTFGGALEATAELNLAPRIAGRIERLHVDLGDEVKRGQLVAELDRAAYEQAARAARAQLAVADAELERAESELAHAALRLQRAEAIFARGSLAQAELDELRAQHTAAAAARAVAKAERERAVAAAEAARIELGYTRLEAHWDGGDDTRVVARRLYREGQTVAAHAPLLGVVELDPLVAVVFVAERDYARIQVGRTVEVRADAYPDATFAATVARVAPAFDAASRQARVELEVPNPDGRLKPGMYVEVSVVLDEADGATIVPAAALTRRDDHDGVFGLDEDGRAARWHPVEIGLREGDRVQLLGPPPARRVVTLGVHQLEDGAAVTVAGAEAGAPDG